MPWCVVTTRRTFGCYGLKDEDGETDLDAASPSEMIVAARIRKAGFRCYLPLAVRVLYPHGKSRRGQRVLRPLLRNYVLVAIDDADDETWSRVLGVIGVAGVLRLKQGGKLLIASDREVEDLRNREQNGEFDEERRRAKREYEVAVDDEVRITAGPFASFLAQVLGLDDAGRAEISVDIFGRPTKTNIDVGDLEKSA
jgi:transcription antitermination factor NusG